MAGEEEWKKKSDTHKMDPEDLKKTGLEGSRMPPGKNPGEILHQRRGLPYRLWTMTLAGFVISGATFYLALYVNKKPEADAMDVAKVTLNAATPEDTHPTRK